MSALPNGFAQWLEKVSAAERADPLWRMASYPLARFIGHLVWDDAGRIRRDSRGCSIADQLLRAAHSVAANVAEGYSRGSGRDRVRMLEYALGSARESIVWYEAAKPILGPDVVKERLDVLVTIRRLLLTTIQRDRRRTIAGHR